MAENKKYYWLKLKRDFFKRHDVRIIEEMPNGKDYVLFYLKLLLESIDHEGELRFSETIPYNEQMLSVVTNTNIDIVRAALSIFTELKMIEVYDDMTIYMNEVQKLIGSETAAAERMRKSRKKQKVLAECNNVQKCYTEIEKETEIHKDLENREEICSVIFDLVEQVSYRLRKENMVAGNLYPLFCTLERGRAVCALHGYGYTLLKGLRCEGYVEGCSRVTQGYAL